MTACIYCNDGSTDVAEHGIAVALLNLLDVTFDNEQSPPHITHHIQDSRVERSRLKIHCGFPDSGIERISAVEYSCSAEEEKRFRTTVAETKDHLVQVCCEYPAFAADII